MNLDLHLTTACNMKCSFCGAWEYGKTQSYISLEDARAALTAGRKAGYRITTLTGGEPSVNSNYLDIIEEAHSQGYWTVVTTNGLHITDDMLRVLKKCRTLVRVSIHTLKPELHAELTGGDTLGTVMGNIDRLRENGVRIGLGCTVMDRNIGEMHDLAAYAHCSGASFIRYTPVVGIRGAEDMHLEYDFFRTMLKNIADMCLDNYRLIDQKPYKKEYAENIVRYMLTRRCAGGSRQHIIYDCSGSVVPCSFIPESEGLCSSTSDGTPEERFRKVYSNMESYFGQELADSLKGECGRCSFRQSCRGGCMTTRIPAGLRPDDEQPVCMYRLIAELCDEYSEEEKHKLENYWCSTFLRRTGAADRDKVCMRRLPIWELNFRYRADRLQFI